MGERKGRGRGDLALGDPRELETEIEAEIRAGLETGERVVLDPSDRVADGVAIDARG